MPCKLYNIGSDDIGLGALVSTPPTNFNKATDELKAHDKKASHLDADLFLKVMSGKQPLVHQQTNIILANRVAALYCSQSNQTVSPQPPSTGHRSISTVKNICSTILAYYALKMPRANHKLTDSLHFFFAKRSQSSSVPTAYNPSSPMQYLESIYLYKAYSTSFNSSFICLVEVIIKCHCTD